MPSLPDIPITLGTTAAPVTDFGHVTALLHECRHALARLAATGEPTRIDLAALPFGPADEALLFDALGRGEVSATIDALGPTRIRETACRGIWVVEYLNTEDQRIGLQLEIAAVPDILRTPAADLADAVAALDGLLASAGPHAPVPAPPQED